MTEFFSTQKVDLSKVSATVKKVVSDIAKTEGSKKKIDTDKEFDMLSQYLSGSFSTMNNDEVNYVQGFMIEYQEKKTKEFEENSVTENTQKTVSQIAKRMGNKKTIDTDEEAQALATMLKNTKGDLNLADQLYIQNLLIKSGYANYLQPSEPVTIVNIVVEEKEAQNTNNGQETPNDKKSEDTNKTFDKPVSKYKSFPKTKPGKSGSSKEANRAAKEADRSKAEADRSKKEADRSKAEADRSKAEADRAKKEADKAQKIANAPKVNEAARAKGFGIASKIQEELHDTWTNNSVIKRELARVDNTNAYSFVGKMLEITDSHDVFGSVYKRVSANDVAHVIRAILGQAKNIGLQSDPAYKNLVETYKFIKRQYVDKNPGDSISDFKDILDLDAQVRALYNRMSKVYK